MLKAETAPRLKKLIKRLENTLGFVKSWDLAHLPSSTNFSYCNLFLIHAGFFLQSTTA
jgi:hypothetical protein